MLVLTPSGFSEVEPRFVLVTSLFDDPKLTYILTCIQLINVWRPLRGPVKDSPLAVCDSRSLNQEKDLVPSQLLYKPPLPQGETYQVAHSEVSSHFIFLLPYISRLCIDETSFRFPGPPMVLPLRHGSQ